MKRIFSLVAVCALMLLAGCGGGQEPLAGAQPEAEVVSDGLWAARQGEWIYYINGDNYVRDEGVRIHQYRGALCRMKQDRSEQAVVVEEDVSLFNIDGEYIWYVAYDDGQSVLCRVRSDSTGKKEILRFDSVYDWGGYAYMEDVIYYVKDGRLYRLDKDSLKSERIGQHEIYNLRVSSQNVYYTVNNQGEPGELYKAAHDSDQPVQLTMVPAFLIEAGEGRAYYYALATGYCYCYDEGADKAEAIAMGGYEEFLFVPEEGFLAGSYISSEEGMYVMPIEGGERLKISDDCAERMIYHDGYIYYINLSEMYELYRIRPDGTDRECVCPDAVSELDVPDLLDGYLYYFSDSDEGRIYRLNLETLKYECVEYEPSGVIGG